MISKVTRPAGVTRAGLSSQEVYTFALGPSGVRLTDYAMLERPSARHKWRATRRQFVAGGSGYQTSNLSRDDVVVPESVISDAMADIRSQMDKFVAATAVRSQLEKFAAVNWDPS